MLISLITVLLILLCGIIITMLSTGYHYNESKLNIGVAAILTGIVGLIVLFIKWI